jgi:hypothetical protein
MKSGVNHALAVGSSRQGVEWRLSMDCVSECCLHGDIVLLVSFFLGKKDFSSDIDLLELNMHGLTASFHNSICFYN